MVLIDPRIDGNQVPLGMTIITEVAKQILPDQGEEQTSYATESIFTSDSIRDRHALNCLERLELFQVVQQQLLTPSQSALTRRYEACQSGSHRIDKKHISAAGVKRHRPTLGV